MMLMVVPVLVRKQSSLGRLGLLSEICQKNINNLAHYFMLCLHQASKDYKQTHLVWMMRSLQCFVWCVEKNWKLML